MVASDQCSIPVSAEGAEKLIRHWMVGATLTENHEHAAISEEFMPSADDLVVAMGRVGDSRGYCR